MGSVLDDKLYGQLFYIYVLCTRMCDYYMSTFYVLEAWKIYQEVSPAITNLGQPGSTYVCSKIHNYRTNHSSSHCDSGVDFRTEGVVSHFLGTPVARDSYIWVFFFFVLHVVREMLSPLVLIVKVSQDNRWESAL